MMAFTSAAFPVSSSFQLVHQLGAYLREVVDEVEGVLDLVGDAGCQLAQARLAFLFG